MEKIPNAVYTRELKERGSKDDNRGWIKGIRGCAFVIDP